MTGRPSDIRPDVADDERVAIVRSGFARGAKTYGDLGSPLYAALLAAGADDPEIVAMACNAQTGAQPAIHLLACVHFLLLGAPGDPRAAPFAALI